MANTNLELQNHFLIAMPQLEDPNFNGSITYICQHNEEGAMGVVINKSSGLELGEIFEQLEMNVDNKHFNVEVMQGGPVQIDRGFVVHNNNDNWDSAYKITSDIQLTTSLDILESLSKEEGPDQFIIALGYAGWGPGQLEEEIVQNSWLTCPASNRILFETPTEEKYELALASMGLDIAKLNAQAGHA